MIAAAGCLAIFGADDSGGNCKSRMIVMIWPCILTVIGGVVSGFTSRPPSNAILVVCAPGHGCSSNAGSIWSGLPWIQNMVRPVSRHTHHGADSHWPQAHIACVVIMIMAAVRWVMISRVEGSLTGPARPPKTTKMCPAPDPLDDVITP